MLQLSEELEKGSRGVKDSWLQALKEQERDVVIRS